MGQQKGRAHLVHELLVHHPTAQPRKTLGLEKDGFLRRQGRRQQQDESQDHESAAKTRKDRIVRLPLGPSASPIGRPCVHGYSRDGLALRVSRSTVLQRSCTATLSSTVMAWRAIGPLKSCVYDVSVLRPTA